MRQVLLLFDADPGRLALAGRLAAAGSAAVLSG